MDAFIVFTQLFAIGFSFGLSAPCIITCMPALFLYVSGKADSLSEAIMNILTLLLGRMLAYVLFGFFVGISIQAVQKVIDFAHFPGIKIIYSLLIILLGLSVWFGKEPKHKRCAKNLLPGGTRSRDFASLFVLGFIVGVSPCPPLIALLFEMVIFVKTPGQGMLFLAAFGLGTLISGLLVFGIMNGLFKYVFDKVAYDQERFRNIYKKLSAVLLTIFGLFMIFKQ